MTKTLKGNSKSSKIDTQKRISKNSTSQKNGSSKMKNLSSTLSNKKLSSDESDSDVKQETSKSSESLSENSAKNSDSDSESDEAHAILHNSQQKGSNHKQPMKGLAEDSNESSEEEDSDSSDSDGIGTQKKTNSTLNERSSSSDSSSSSSSDNDSSEDEEDETANKHKSSDNRSSASEQSSSESESDSESDSDSEAESIEGSQTRVSSSSKSSTSDDDSENDVDLNTVNNTNEKANKRKAPIQSPILAKKAKTDGSSDYSSSKTSTVFVGKLSYNVDAEWLRRELAEAGEIVDVHIVTDRETQRPKGFAYVDFANPQAAEAALSLSGKVINGRPVKIDLCRPKDISQPRDMYKKPIPHGTGSATDTIFIGNLSFDVNEEQLRKLFEKTGEIVSVRLPTNPETQQLKGFGYVQFSNTNAVEKAMRFHGKNFMGRTIRLDYASTGRDFSNGTGNVGYRNNWGGRDGRGGRGNGRGRGDGRGRGRGRGRGSYGGLTAAKNRGSIVAGQGSKIKFE